MTCAGPPPGRAQVLHNQRLMQLTQKDPLFSVKPQGLARYLYYLGSPHKHWLSGRCSQTRINTGSPVDARRTRLGAARRVNKNRKKNFHKNKKNRLRFGTIWNTFRT